MDNECVTQKHVLIVEDDAETRGFVAKGFAEAGFAVEQAETGRDGLYLATDGGFDGIVLDRMLPGLDGLAVLKSLRAAGVTSPALLKAFLEDGTILKDASANIRFFSRGTTHVSIADSEGNCASMTCSNGEGSGYIVPGTGVMLNNMMGEDDLHPNGFHSSPPGERVGSMMSPSLARTYT